MEYKSSLQLNFMAYSTISIFCLCEHSGIYSERLFLISKPKERMFVWSFFFTRTRTPLIRVTYFCDFVNRFLKNIFEKILQKSIAICEYVCYNKA